MDGSPPKAPAKRYPHRIRGSALVFRADRILLVTLEHKLLRETFWELPGGGWELGDASILDTARREAFEEAGVSITTSRIVYIEECVDHALGVQFLSVVALADSAVGEPGLSNLEPQLDTSPIRIVDARWYGQSELRTLNVHPPALRQRVWDDFKAGFPTTVNLGRVDLGRRSP